MFVPFYPLTPNCTMLLQEKGDTLLIMAARLGRDELVDLILGGAGAAIEAKNKVGDNLTMMYVGM